MSIDFLTIIVNLGTNLQLTCDDMTYEQIYNYDSNINMIRTCLMWNFERES